MKRSLFLVLIALPVVLAVAGYAHSTQGPNAQLAHMDRLYGGGGTDKDCFVPDIGFCRQVTTDFAIDAQATANGHAAYGSMEGIAGAQRSVTCLSIDGGNAVVGGFTLPLSSDAPQLWLQYFVDNGPGVQDLVSPLYLNPDDPADWPPGFPYVCPSPDVGVDGLGIFRSFIHVVRGDIVVQDASS